MDKVVHFEIPVDDIERAKQFYSKMFGWDMETYPAMNYTILRTGPVDKERMPKEPGFINGGMMKRNDKVRNPIITISVENIDKTMEMIKENSGKIVGEKMKVGDMGYAAYFQDSEGNIIGLWQNLS